MNNCLLTEIMEQIVINIQNKIYFIILFQR